MCDRAKGIADCHFKSNPCDQAARFYKIVTVAKAAKTEYFFGFKEWNYSSLILLI